MSILTRTTLLSARVARPLVLRPFSTTLQARKSATESVKDGLKTVDRAVADKLVDGIETGEKLSQQAKGMADQAKGKSSEAKGEAMGTAHEMKGEAKGKASELSGKMSELASKAEAKTNEVKGKL